ncbi:unnamed protein product [Laminaria digitata]
MRNCVARAAFTRGLDSVCYSRYKTRYAFIMEALAGEFPAGGWRPLFAPTTDKHVCAVPLLALRLVDFRPASLFSLKPLASVFCFLWLISSQNSWRLVWSISACFSLLAQNLLPLLLLLLWLIASQNSRR